MFNNMLLSQRWPDEHNNQPDPDPVEYLHRGEHCTQ